MSTALFLAGGLGTGLALAIWLLVERRKRHQAELSTQAAKSALAATQEANRQAAALTARQKEDLRRADEQLAQLRRLLNEARQRLLQCRDPATVKQWLDDELRRTTWSEP